MEGQGSCGMQKAHSILDQVPLSCPPAFFLPHAQPPVATAPPTPLV